MKSARIVYGTEEESYWPSFANVMSAVALVLLFFIVFLVVRQLVAAKAWEASLAKADADLSGKQAQLDIASQSLESINNELNVKKQEVNSMESALTGKETEIDTLGSRLEEEQARLDQKEAELARVQGKLQDISVLRTSILNQIKDSIEKKVGSIPGAGGGTPVGIDDNANLVINSSLLFAKGSSGISADGQKILREFAVAFQNILDDSSVRSNIDSIVVSGYADSDGTYESNYSLSCERAVEVIKAMMKANPVLEKTYGKYFQASGFSSFRPVAAGDDEAAKSKNRRIQISINIKDSNLQQIISDYMNKP